MSYFFLAYIIIYLTLIVFFSVQFYIYKLLVTSSIGKNKVTCDKMSTKEIRNGLFSSVKDISIDILSDHSFYR